MTNEEKFGKALAAIRIPVKKFDDGLYMQCPVCNQINYEISEEIQHYDGCALDEAVKLYGIKYQKHDSYNHIYAFKTPDSDGWLPCKNCGLKPRVWIYDNGANTACGCWNNKYDHFTVCAESPTSRYKNDGIINIETEEDLKNNWNHWVKTDEHLFDITSSSAEGRW